MKMNAITSEMSKSLTPANQAEEKWVDAIHISEL